MKIIQRHILILLLASGLIGAAQAETSRAKQRPPTVDRAAKSAQPDAAATSIHKEKQLRNLYAWDRVGKPMASESFLI